MVRKENAAATVALAWLVAVSVSKTILTKLVFVHINLPVAYSVLSCVVTAVCLIPILICYPGNRASKGDGDDNVDEAGARRSALRMPPKSILRGLCAVSVAIMLDLACTNVALSLISVALQQSIKATSPAATMIIESLYHRKTQHPVMWLVVAMLCLGPLLISAGSRHEAGRSTLFGSFMMIAGVISGAFKYVFAHAAMQTYKHELGTLGFLYWIEIIVAIELAPWAIANGEASKMMTIMDFSGGGDADSGYALSKTLLLLGTAAFGGVRIYTQFAFLKETSATSLSMTNLATQALTIALSILFFSTPFTPLLGSGVSVTIIMSAVYAYLKITKPFEKKAASAALPEDDQATSKVELAAVVAYEDVRGAKSDQISLIQQQ